MPRPLRQSDVDALLRDLRARSGAPAPGIVDLAALTGAVAAPGPEVRPYDFLKPARVPAGRRAAIEAAFDRFAGSLGDWLTPLLRVPADVAVRLFEPTTRIEFTRTLAAPCAAFTLRLPEAMGGAGAFDLGGDLAFHVLDRVFGGTGADSRVERALTPLEQSVARSVLERALPRMAAAFPEAEGFAPALGGFTADPAALADEGPDDPVLVVVFEVRVGGFVAEPSLCLPGRAVERLIPARRAAKPATAPDPTSRAAIARALRRAGVTVTARLPVLRLPARALMEVREGQVLRTPHAADAPVEIHVNGRPRFLGALGQVRGRIGLRVTGTVPGPWDGSAGRAPGGRNG
jgi:flagellar motor switch protein FliM